MSTTSDFKIVRCPICAANNHFFQNETAAKAPICGRCKTLLSAVPPQPAIVNDANYKTLVENSSLPVLLDLWVPWCNPCRTMSTVIDRLAIELNGHVRVGKLNVDENPQTAVRLRMQGIPTLLVLKDGREIDRIVGAQSKEAILSKL